MSAEGDTFAESDPFASSFAGAAEADPEPEPLDPNEFTFLSGPGARSGDPFAAPAAPEPSEDPAPPATAQEESEHATPADAFGFVALPTTQEDAPAEAPAPFAPPPAEPAAFQAPEPPAPAPTPPQQATYDPFADAAASTPAREDAPSFAPVAFFDPATEKPTPEPPAPPQSPSFAAADSFADDVSGDGAAAEPNAAEAPAEASSAKEEAAPGTGDDSLLLISSIDEPLQKQLQELGVNTLDEIARWSRTDARKYAGQLQVSEQEIMNRWIFEAQSALFERYQQQMRQG